MTVKKPILHIKARYTCGNDKCKSFYSTAEAARRCQCPELPEPKTIVDAIMNLYDSRGVRDDFRFKLTEFFLENRLQPEQSNEVIEGEFKAYSVSNSSIVVNDNFTIVVHGKEHKKMSIEIQNMLNA